MIWRLEYTHLSLFSPKEFVRYVLSTMRITETVVPPSGLLSNWASHNHRKYDEIHLMYLLLPPPGAWFHFWVDMFLNINQFHFWSIQHMFPQCWLLKGKISALNRIEVRKTCVIIVAKCVWISYVITTLCVWHPGINGHSMWHLVHHVELSAGQSKIAEG